MVLFHLRLSPVIGLMLQGFENILLWGFLAMHLEPQEVVRRSVSWKSGVIACMLRWLRGTTPRPVVRCLSPGLAGTSFLTGASPLAGFL